MNQSGGILVGLQRLLGRKQTRTDLIQKEVAATRGLFARQASREYDFFYYGETENNVHEWIFHDWCKRGREWQVNTTRYLVYPDRVYRAKEGETYQQITGSELDRFYKAIKRYHDRVAQNVYNR